MEEIKFISLPSTRDLRNFTGMHKGKGEKAGIFQPLEDKLNRYEQGQFRIWLAQRKCAVIAAEIMRPQDLREAQQERRAALEQAKRKYEDAALAVFSETCTKGM